MELTYSNKKPAKQILAAAKEYDALDSGLLTKSILFEGDNFDALSHLLNTKSNFIDLIYIDPPFNTNQKFLVSDSRANSISRKKAGQIAYSDSMSKEEYLEFMRERLILMYEILSSQGSLYVHTDIKTGHYLKIILDEIFGEDNFKNDITRIKSNPKNFKRNAYGNQKDIVLFYAKNAAKNIWNEIKVLYGEGELIKRFSKIDKDGKRYTTVPLHAPGECNGETGGLWRGMLPPEGRHWRTNPANFDKLDEEGLIEWSSNGNPRIKKFAEQHIGKKVQDVWEFKDPQAPIYPTQKNAAMIELIIAQSSLADSYVMDCFAGSGIIAAEAHKAGRKFICMDCSDLAIDTIKNRNDLGEYSIIRV